MQKRISGSGTRSIQKAGEIIPQIVSVQKELRPDGTEPYRFPEHCPVCGAPVVRDEDGAHIRCTGAECPAQLLRHRVHFASRDAMDIEGLGPAVVEALVRAELVKGPGDLYHLDAGQVAELERDGKKSAENLIAALERSKETTSPVPACPPLDPAGRTESGQGARCPFRKLDALMAASEEVLTAVPDIGGITAHSIVEWFRSPQSRHLIQTLQEAGVNMKQSRKSRLEINWQGRLLC